MRDLQLLPLVEAMGGEVWPPRKEQVVGSIPTGGSTSHLRKLFQHASWTRPPGIKRGCEWALQSLHGCTLSTPRQAAARQHRGAAQRRTAGPHVRRNRFTDWATPLPEREHPGLPQRPRRGAEGHASADEPGRRAVQPVGPTQRSPGCLIGTSSLPSWRTTRSPTTAVRRRSTSGR